MEGAQVGEIDLNDAVFGVDVKENLMHKAVVAQLAGARQGTQSAKTRSEVSGGGRKPWRQKGTGHARQGSIRAPQWTGGGMVFAPKPRDYEIKVNKKERALAIKSKKFVAFMNNIKAQKALIVLAGKDENVEMSAHNVPGVKTALTNTINTYDILKYDTLVLTQDAVNAITEVYA